VNEKVKVSDKDAIIADLQRRLSNIESKENSRSNNNTNEDDFALAARQSFGFFDDVPSRDWKVHQEILAKYSKHMYPHKPLSGLPTKIAGWYQQVRSRVFSCISMCWMRCDAIQSSIVNLTLTRAFFVDWTQKELRSQF